MSKVNERQLSGNGWQQLTQIVEFHEKRLNRLDKFAGETVKSKKEGGDSELEERLVNLEEHSNIVMTSMEQNTENMAEISTSVANGITKSNKSLAESKKIATSTRVFPAKLSVMTEKFRVLSEKVEGLIGKIEELEQQLSNKSMNNITFDIDGTGETDGPENNESSD